MSGPKSPALCLNLTAVDWLDILRFRSHAIAQHDPIAPLTASATNSERLVRTTHAARLPQSANDGVVSKIIRARSSATRYC